MSADLIFEDGFESGAAGMWSTSVGEVCPCPPDGLSRYDHSGTVAQMTSCVADRMRAISAVSAGPEDQVFMKAGASDSASANFLQCFSELSYAVDLDGRTQLQTTIDWFAAGDAAGMTPYERVSAAVGIGRTATWAITGAPAPFEQEIAAINPRLALVAFGTNDMESGTSYATALPSYYESMSVLLEELEAAGVVPILSGLNPRSDSTDAERWVPTWDVVTRGIAEERQLPYLSLYRSMVGLPDMGLGPDGIHGTVYVDGETGNEPCVFTAAALQFNYNLRNLRTLELLDSVRRVGLGSQPAPFSPESWTGSGAAGDPFLVDRLPFTHSADTAESPNDLVDAYPLCGAQDESGPEYWYRLELAEQKALRFVVLDREGVDVDIHLIAGVADPAGCIGYGHRIIDTTLAAGVYHISVDTFVSSGLAQSGPYLFAVIECETGDPDCF